MFYGFLATIFNSLSQPLFKIIFLKYPTISSFEVAYWNSLIMLLVNYFFIKNNNAFILDVPRKYHKHMLLRSFCGFIGYLGLVASVKFMPVSTASCIYFTLPIWTAIIAFVFLNEKINKYDVLQIFSAFLGIMIINNPFSSNEISEKEVSKKNDYQDSKIYS